jgi:acetyl-CoA C-acetyltransferase
MKAIALGAASIKAGENEVVIAGGMENMSDAPIALPKARWGYRMDMPYGQTVDLMVFDGLYEIFYGYHMGITAENIAAKYGITREEQDRLGLDSHLRARAAIASGILRDEIVPVKVPRKKGDPLEFDVDERPWTPPSRRWANSQLSSRRMERSRPATRRASTTRRPLCCS